MLAARTGSHPLLLLLATALATSCEGGGSALPEPAPSPGPQAPSAVRATSSPGTTPPGGAAAEPDFTKAVSFQPAGPLSAGADGRLAGALVITVAPGFHIYGPTEAQSIPTALTLPGEARVTWPPATEKDLGPLGKHHVYTGEVRLPFTLPAPAPDAREVAGTLRYQACTDKVCAFPVTKPVAFTIVR